MRTPHVSPRPRRFGFTLVELLVVIGIIALLISILMPSLARARGSAISLDCQARMRVIGQGMQMYAAQYKGNLPLATNYLMVNGGWKSKPAATILSETLGSPEWTVNRIFEDKETIEPDANPVIGSNAVYSGSMNNDWVVSHYVPNIRVFPWTPVPGTSSISIVEKHYSGSAPTKAYAAPRNLGDIKNSAEVAAWWDASQITSWPGAAGQRLKGSYPYSDGMSDWGWHNPINRFVSIDNMNPSYNGNVTVVSLNNDAGGLGSPQGQGGIRFRHMKDTVANILYVDGHVGSHTFNKATGKTSMPIRELGSNVKPAMLVP
jgi:prepilin-type N-terminal cleavage/methylation domain-containing protein/prepilin-type processing-associated H-X9-DG protein